MSLNGNLSPRAGSPPKGLEPERLFWTLLAAGVLLHLALGCALYGAAAGASDDPLRLVVRWLHLPDAYRYHYDAWKVHLFWGLNLDLPNPLGAFLVERFTMLVIGAYGLFTPHPLVMICLQPFCMGAAGILARRLALGLGQPPARAAWLALLVVCWPPTFVWTAAPTKEPWTLMAAFVFLAALMHLLRNPKRAWGWAAASLALPAAVFFLVFTRFYFWKILIVLGPMLLAAALAASWLKGSRPAWARLGWAGLLLALGLTASLPFNVEFGYIFGAAPPPGQKPSFAPKPDPRQYRPKGLERVAPTVDEAMIIRRRFEVSGGRSLPPDRLDSRWRGPIHLLKQAARGARDIILFPYPWQRWPYAPRWGLLQAGVSGVSLFWYALLPGVAAGILAGLKREPAGALCVLLWSLGLGMALGLVVLNLGTLFRLRDMAVLPLLLLWNPAPYLWARGRPGGPGGRPPAQAG